MRSLRFVTFPFFLAVVLGWGTLFVGLGTHALAQASISPSEAAQFIGQSKTVCGKVVAATYVPRLPPRYSAYTSATSGTFLNFGKPYPNQDFSAVIWVVENRTKFEEPPETVFKDQTICVTGLIKTEGAGGRPQIEVRSPEQITPDGEPGRE